MNQQFIQAVLGNSWREAKDEYHHLNGKVKRRHWIDNRRKRLTEENHE